MSTPSQDRPAAGTVGARRPRRRPVRRRACVALVAAVALALVACSAPAPEPEPSPTTTTPSVDLAKKPRPAPLPARWPLTGVAAEIVARPALSVKVENSAAARPQTGLEDADVVWEELVEGGITRFNAVYHSAVPEVVGPVRSVRPMDAAIVGPLGGLMAFSGGQPAFVQQIRDAGLQVLSHDEGAPGLYRVGTRRAPHNVYGSGPDLLAQADAAHAAPPGEQLAHAWDAASASAAEAGVPASRIALSFPSTAPGWTWDAAADAGRGGGPGVWVRDEGGAAQVSADGERIVATNVVVLRVQVVQTNALDPVGNRVPETVLTGGGTAFVASGGKVLEGTWSKAGTLDPLVLTAPDGTGVALAPGNTWIELVPVDGGAATVQ